MEKGTSGGENELPDFAEGYQIWKKSCEEGEGGALTVSVAEGVAIIEQTLNQ